MKNPKIERKSCRKCGQRKRITEFRWRRRGDSEKTPGATCNSCEAGEDIKALCCVMNAWRGPVTTIGGATV